MSDAPQLLTVGHSNHPVGDFQRLLAEHGVEVLVDVRSWPHSRYVQWADRAELAEVVGDARASARRKACGTQSSQRL